MAEPEAPEKVSKLKRLMDAVRGGFKLKKLLVVGGGGILVLALLGGGGYYGWKKWQAVKAAKAAAAAPVVPAAGELPPAEGDDSEEDVPVAKEGEGGGGPAVLIYKNNVNLDGKKNTYLVVEFDILFRDQELGKLATSDKPTPENSIIRSIILEAISGKTIEEASDMEFRESIRLDIKDRLNEKFAPKPPKPGEKVDEAHKKPKKPVKDVLVVSWAIAQ
jgi:flagellar basal body-associated protein FliL